jgi:D-3-phosphoglycerate dehydrogenase
MSVLVISTDEKEHPVSATHLRMINEAGGHLRYVERPEEFAAEAPAAVVVLNASFRLPRERIALLRNCQLIARYGTGVDNIDVEAATKRNILVSNVPDFCSSQVANHTMTLLLACAFRLRKLDTCVRTGQWDIRTSHYSEDLEDQVLGLVGFGRIAREVAERALAFGMRTVTCDPYVEPSTVQEQSTQLLSFEELLTVSDYVSLHLPFNRKTHHLLNREALCRMKSTAYLINCSRGPIVDHRALAHVLSEGLIAGAGLDVYEVEPPSRDDPLFQLENVVLTPHCAANTSNAYRKLRDETIANAVAVLQGGDPKNVVNPAAAHP